MRKSSVLSSTILLAAMLITGANPALVLADLKVADLTRAVSKPEFDRLFKKYELVKIDQQQAAAEVRRSGRFSFATSQVTWNLVLSHYDMRASNYRATSIGPNGLTSSLDVGPVNTFKGVVVGSNGSQVRFTIDQRHFEGLIIKDGDYYYLESARKFSPSIEATYFVFYKASDVIQDTISSCSVMTNTKLNALRDRIASGSSQSLSSDKVIELATEADYEYVTSLGGPANADSEILSIMNQVEGVYESELGLTFQIVFQNTWDTAADPYSTTGDSIQILTEFQNYWNANFTNVSRDLAHLWTGKNMGGVLGRAFQSVACSSPSLSYGVSRIDDRIPLKYNTPAHEIAHNLGASHADGVPECVGSIMNPTTTSGLTFCQYSRDEIANYLSFYGFCLTPTITNNISGQVTDINGKPVSGVTVSLTAPQSLTSETDSSGGYAFHNLTRGMTYVVTASKTNYSFTPQNQTFANLNNDQTAFFTVIESPDGPLLATEPNSNKAIALDSVTFLGDPFPIITAYNFSPDHHTRVALFAVNILLAPGENLSVVNVQAEDAPGKVYLLPVESVDKVPNIDWLTQITVRLPDEIQGTGNILLSVNLRGVISNKSLIKIAP